MKIAVVILTTPPLGRFMDPAGVFFAVIVVRALLRRWELVRIAMVDWTSVRYVSARFIAFRKVLDPRTQGPKDPRTQGRIVLVIGQMSTRDCRTSQSNRPNGVGLGRAPLSAALGSGRRMLPPKAPTRRPPA